MPVTMPAPGASPSYMPCAASGESSRNGRARIEERVDALAREELAALGVTRARGARRPRRARPRCAHAARRRGVCMAAAFSRNSGLSVRMRLSMRGVVIVTDRHSRTPRRFPPDRSARDQSRGGIAAAGRARERATVRAASALVDGTGQTTIEPERRAEAPVHAVTLLRGLVHLVVAAGRGLPGQRRARAVRRTRSVLRAELAGTSWTTDASAKSEQLRSVPVRNRMPTLSSGAAMASPVASAVIRILRPG